MERRAGGPRSGFATVTPAFIDTTELSQISDGDDDDSEEFNSSNRGDSPVRIEEHPSLSDMTFRASHSSFSQSQTNSQRGGNKLTATTFSERLTMMNIPTQELKGTVYYGWLWKKGSSFKTWKKRFFLLHGRALTYYTQCCVIASDMLGTQCLDMPAKGGLRVASVELTNETKYGLKVTSSSGRVLFIQAGDQGARMQWLEVLDEAPRKKFMESSLRGTTMSEYPFSSSRSNTPLDFTNSSSSSQDGGSAATVSFQSSSLSTMSSSEGEEEFSGASDKRGWLQLRSGVLHSWKKRYVTLLDGNITITSHRRSKRPQDKAYAVIACTPFSGHANAFCVRLDRNKELYMSAASETEAEAWIEAFKNCL